MLVLQILNILLNFFFATTQFRRRIDAADEIRVVGVGTR